MQIVSGPSIRAAIEEVEPTHIAVAYVGADWREYLPNNMPAELIASPTLGSNPHALAEIGEAIGWDHLHLLDELHAKIYLSATGAVIGSCNLTKNGLHGGLLEEVAVWMLPGEAAGQAQSEFARLRLKAQEQYPTQESKHAAVQALERLWNRAISTEVIGLPASTKRRTIADYADGNDAFYVSWDTGVFATYNESLLADALDDVAPGDVGRSINSGLTFLDSDEIEAGKWILCWRPTVNGFADRRFRPYWIYIHHVIPHGAIEEPYTKVAVCRNDKTVPPYPFDVADSRVVSAIYDVLNEPEFGAFRFDGYLHSPSWDLAPTLPLFRGFIERVKSIALAP